MKAKRCRMCKRLLPYQLFYRDKKTRDGFFASCKTCTKARLDRHPGAKEKRAARQSKWKKENAGRHLNTARERRIALRREVLTHYSAGDVPECACCGERTYEFLCLDHKNNDGSEHRKSVPGSRLIWWCRANGFPDLFQVLCFNCNNAKHWYKVCPHNRKPRPPANRKTGQSVGKTTARPASR